MTEKQEKEYIHWQELAEQLGADTTTEIDDYFGGTASFSDIELDDSELPDMLPELPPVEVASEPINDETVAVEAVEQSETVDAVATEAPASANELDNEIGWNTPTPEKTAAEKPKKNAKTKKKMNKKPAAKTESKAQPKPAPETGDDNHWDFLASTLGLEEPATASTPVADDAATPEPVSEISKPLPKVETSPRPTPEKAPEATGFGAGLIDFDEIKPSEEEVTQENILSEMFVASETSFEQVETTVTHSEADGVTDDAATVSGFDDDEEFVEFEVEDLDPGGRRPAGQRKPRRGRETGRGNRSDKQEEVAEERGARSKKPRAKDDRDESDRPRRKRKKRPESEVENQEEPRTRKRRSNDDDDESSDDRPRKRRANRAETTNSDERPRKRKSERTDEGDDEERPRKRRSRRPRSEKSQASNQISDVENYDDEGEERAEPKSRRGGKSDDKTRKLPTWADTVEVIVETNISSRKKPPKKKRGGGGGRSRRGGGNNRDRDRN